MALADYASPVDDAGNPLLPLRDRRGLQMVTDGGSGPRCAHACGDCNGLTRTSNSPSWHSGRSNGASLTSRWKALAATGASACRVGRRNRLEHQGHPTRPTAAGSRGRLCVSPHGRRRARRWRGACARRRCRRAAADSLPDDLGLGPEFDERRSNRPHLARPALLRSARHRRGRRRALSTEDNRVVVSGPHGVRPARAGTSKRAGAARSAGVARSHQPAAEAPGLVPAVLSQPARRARARGF